MPVLYPKFRSAQSNDEPKSKDRKMTPRKIWGVIIIACGIFFVFNGTSTYNAANVLKDEIRIKKERLSKLVGSQFDERPYVNRAEREKHKAFIGIFFGVSMTIVGAFFLRGKIMPLSAPFPDPFDDEFDNKNREWRL